MNVWIVYEADTYGDYKVAGVTSTEKRANILSKMLERYKGCNYMIEEVEVDDAFVECKKMLEVAFVEYKKMLEDAINSFDECKSLLNEIQSEGL